MKKQLICVLLTLIIIVGLLPTTAWAAPEDIGSNENGNETVMEVRSWNEFKEAFQYSNYQGESYTIKLMNDLHYDAGDAARSATALIDVHVKGCSVTLDFNGYTLSCTDAVSSTDLQSMLSDFIRIQLHPLDGRNPIEFRLTDSVGGGGVSMESYRAYDNQLAALHIVDACDYVIDGLYQSCPALNKLIIDGGNYSLAAKTEKIGRGTNEPNTFYRGTVIADAVSAVEINGGTFTAESDGVMYDGDDFCARELSAYATCSNASENSCAVVYEHTVINGGTFISDGYSIHHFDHSGDVNETRSMKFPRINGGIFSGSIGYIGMSFTYKNYDDTGYGVEEYREKSASEIINSDAYVRCIKDNKLYELEDLTLIDLHEAKSLMVMSDSLFGFKTQPETGDITDLERHTDQIENFKVQYKVPYGLNENIATPYITLILNDGTTVTEEVSEKEISYKNYPDGLTVKAGIFVNYAIGGFYYENTYNITVTKIPTSAEIISQPRSVNVAPGEYAEATVVANHAKAYQWYYMFEGTPMPLTDDLVSRLDIEIAGYTSPTLRMAVDSVTKEQFYCVVTGMDDTTVKTDKIYFTYGQKPSVNGVSGGVLYAGDKAEFKMWPKYAERITWFVTERKSGSFNIYTLDEFSELTGCEYETKHKSFTPELYSASVLFKNPDASWAGKYEVGYELENSLGKVAFNPENTVPFTLYVKRPEIISFIETQSCIEGESLTFTFEAEDMASAEWIFEKQDEEGIPVAYTIDKMKVLFPDTSFVTSVSGKTATLTVNNVRSELCDYLLWARAIGESASASAGSAQFNVISEIEEKDVVTLNATELNNWTIGKSGNFTVYVNGVRVNPATMTWTSSDTSVATCVDGYLVAVGAGTATITCTRENATEATCTVTVKGLDVVTLNATELNNWTVGQSGNFIVYVNGVRVKPATMTWTSSDTSVATCVDGYLVAKGAGTATITCTRENATEAKCKVTVKAMDIVALNAVSLNGWTVGKSGYFTPYINGVRVARTKLTWKSSNTAVATCVDGYLVAKGAGTAIITCTRNNATVASCTVTVKGNDVVTLNATELTNWAVGKTGSFYAYVNGKRVGNNTMTWSSSNTAVATCEKGVLTAKGPGTAIITCTRPGATAAKCTVTVKGNDVVTLNAAELTNWTVGKTGTFYAYVNGRRVNNSTMTWSSSNTAVATCENGVLVAKGKGTAVISCTRANATVATCKVTVK